jgi:hypothetical protein
MGVGHFCATKSRITNIPRTSTLSSRRERLALVSVEFSMQMAILMEGILFLVSKRCLVISFLADHLLNRCYWWQPLVSRLVNVVMLLRSIVIMWRWEEDCLEADV